MEHRLEILGQSVGEPQVLPVSNLRLARQQLHNQPTNQRTTDAAESTTRTALQIFKERLRDAAISGKDLPEKDKVYHLKNVYSEREMYSDVIVEKFRTDPGQKLIEFRRLTSVYSRQMYNIFLMPVWAAAHDEEAKNGYVLHPKLTSVKDMLDTLSVDDEEALKHALRLCFLPVALAIEALHTHVPNRRTMYYHRDIHIGNVFLPSEKKEGNVNEKGDSVYGEAKLKLTRMTRGSHEEFMDMSFSHDQNSIPEMYFHHPDPWNTSTDEGSTYHRMHDWFSFGVYVLEVLGIVLERELIWAPASSGKLNHYKHEADQLSEVVNGKEWQDEVTAPLLLQYLDIAKECLNMDQAKVDEVRMHYEFADALKQRFRQFGTSFEPYYFEYGLHGWTAQLLKLFDGPSLSQDDYESYHQIQCDRALSMEPEYADREDICQACLLHCSVKIPTRTYRRGAVRRRSDRSGSKCDLDCDKAYCAACYTNGERLFCLRQHGTTSSVIGHPSSFALILYGLHDEVKSRDLFASDAHLLSNVLMHKLICGFPNENVIVEPLYGERSSKDILEAVCSQMRRKIHNRRLLGGSLENTDVCENETDYSLFIFYSGHGKDTGDWCPRGCADGDFIKFKDVNRLLNTIRSCNNPSCHGSCVEIKYVLDHCYTRDGMLKVAKHQNHQSYTGSGYEETPSRVTVATVPNQRANAEADGHSEITHWFCQLLRCLYRTQRHPKPCKVCDDLDNHIKDKCNNAFIDGECVDIHKRHMCAENNYTTKVTVHVLDEAHDRLILAHHRPQGIFFQIFPYKEEKTTIQIGFHVRIKCHDIIEAVKERLRVRKICLLTSRPNDYSRFNFVSDDTVRDILDSSLLFYHVIKHPTKIRLVAHGGPDGDIEEDIPNVDIDKADLPQLINECRTGDQHIACIPQSQQPNILAHLVHHLRYKVYEDGVSNESSADEAMEAADETAQPASGMVQATVELTRATGHDAELVRNSFAGLLYLKPRPGVRVKELTSEGWQELQDQASQYLRKKEHRFFAVTSPGDGMVSIEWKLADLVGSDPGSDAVNDAGDDTNHYSNYRGPVDGDPAEEGNIASI